MALVGSRTAKRVAVETLGWLLVAGGVAALILPGPGLFMVVAGLALLSQQHEWAARRVEPLKQRALRTAEHGVATWPRIAGSVLGALVLVGLGVLWCVQPAAPGWWPVADRYWLVGGWGAGLSLIVSGLVALALVVYSIVEFRGTVSADEGPDVESVVARLRSSSLMPPVKSISVEGEKNVLVIGVPEAISDRTKAEIVSAVGKSFLLRVTTPEHGVYYSEEAGMAEGHGVVQESWIDGPR